MNWKKILLKDIGKFCDVLVKLQPNIVDLVRSINKRANETRFLCDVKPNVFSQKAREGFLSVNTSDRKMSVIVDQNIYKKGIFLSISFSLVNLMLGCLELEYS